MWPSRLDIGPQLIANPNITTGFLPTMDKYYTFQYDTCILYFVRPLKSDITVRIHSLVNYSMNAYATGTFCIILVRANSVRFHQSKLFRKGLHVYKNY